MYTVALVLVTKLIIERECSTLSISLVGKRIRAVVIILILSAAHSALVLYLLTLDTGYKAERLNGGLASYIERMLDILTNILLFPLSFMLEVLPQASFPGLWGYIPFGLNSLLWGLGFYHVFIFIPYVTKNEAP